MVWKNRTTSQGESLPPPEVVFGKTDALRAIKERIERLASAPVPVLIQGESGTGKEVVAHVLHAYGDRESAPFVKVCCPAIPSALLEAELFGYEKGAFTGAYGTKRGRIESAHNGTLFLDEIGDLDGALQAKLLQVLQDGTFSRIGDHQDRTVNVRLISATNRDLRNSSAFGTFRSDLLYRINAITIELPPLRNRVADLPVLVDHFLNIYTRKFQQDAKPLSPQLLQAMTKYHWPGNIRELENFIRRYVILGAEDAVMTDIVTSQSIINAEVEFGPNISLKQITKRAIQNLEREIIVKALQTHDWNRRRTAKSLKMSYRSLLYKIREAGIGMIQHARDDAAGKTTARAAAGKTGD